MSEPASLPPLYTRQEFRQMALILLACFGVHALSLLAFPTATLLYPAAGVALAGLFFSGARMWPAIFLGILGADLITGQAFPLGYLAPAAITLQALLGAHLMQRARIDPLFRRNRDSLYVVTSIIVASLVTPTVFLLAPEHLYSGWRWSYGFVATMFSLLAVTPFLLRWIAKPRFRRSRNEGIEILIVLALTAGIDLALFTFDVRSVFGVPVIYVLLIPLFWTAVRLRPRWVTAAILMTSGFAIAAALAGSTSATLVTNLYEVELLLVTIAISFYTVVALEEDRRANTNLARSQLATLENAVSRISSESQAKNDFIAILAHELRNPLAPVVSAIELMKIRGTQTPEEAESLEVMETSMHTVKRLLDDLLDISRISEGKIALKREVIDLGHVVRRAVVSTAHHFKERHQTLAFSGSRKPLRVSGDPVRLEQVFSNLLTNASRYSKSGDTVLLSITERDGMGEVRVKDEGVGIHPDAIDTIFLPFHQLQPGRQGSKKGLGIGLALVQSFVDMHDGVVHAESVGENKGSTFVVRLPLVDAEPTPSPKPRSRTHLPKGKHGLRVLVVDDNDAAAAGIGRLLELQGCEVHYAYSGSQALDSAGQVQPEVIILDIGMQDQDGYSVAATLRTRGYTGILIALSGFSTPEAREKGMAAGFDHYLVKPAGLAELRKAIPRLN